PLPDEIAFLEQHRLEHAVDLGTHCYAVLGLDRADRIDDYRHRLSRDRHRAHGDWTAIASASAFGFAFRPFSRRLFRGCGIGMRLPPIECATRGGTDDDHRYPERLHACLLKESGTISCRDRAPDIFNTMSWHFTAHHRFVGRTQG